MIEPKVEKIEDGYLVTIHVEQELLSDVTKILGLDPKECLSDLLLTQAFSLARQELLKTLEVVWEKK